MTVLRPPASAWPPLRSFTPATTPRAAPGADPPSAPSTKLAAESSPISLPLATLLVPRSEATPSASSCVPSSSAEMPAPAAVLPSTERPATRASSGSSPPVTSLPVKRSPNVATAPCSSAEASSALALVMRRASSGAAPASIMRRYSGLVSSSCSCDCLAMNSRAFSTPSPAAMAPPTAPAAPGLRVASAVATTGNIEPNTSAPCIRKPRTDGSLPKSISPLSRLPVIWELATASCVAWLVVSLMDFCASRPARASVSAPGRRTPTAARSACSSRRSSCCCVIGPLMASSVSMPGMKAPPGMTVAGSPPAPLRTVARMPDCAASGTAATPERAAPPARLNTSVMASAT